jgi:hypothetical protein
VLVSDGNYGSCVWGERDVPYGLMKKYKRWGAGDGALDSFGILRTPETPALESY